MKAVLRIMEGENAGRKAIMNPNNKVVIGRHHVCEMIVDDPRISRVHALVIFSEKGSIVIDLGSHSGVYLNDRRIDKSALTFGDELRIGSTLFKFERLKSTEESGSSSPKEDKETVVEDERQAGHCKNCGKPVLKSHLPPSLSEQNREGILCQACRQISGQLCEVCKQFVSQEHIVLGKGVKAKGKFYCEEHLPLDPQTRRLIAQYKLLMPLGGGAVSHVYKAKHLYLNTLVALKIMKSALAEQQNVVQRFFQEAQFGVRLEHPNIIRIYDAGKLEGIYYLVMEYFDGETLFDIGCEKPFSVSQVIQIARQLFAAVEYAHSWGIIHRDIKPSNILINETGEVKLTDLGAAKAWDNPQEGGLTQPGQFIGTLRYQPPEQIANAKSVDQRADVYALAATLFFCLTGQPPFQGKTLAEVLDKVLGGKRMPIRESVPNLPEPLADLIDSGLQRDIDQRSQSVAELRTLLERL